MITEALLVLAERGLWADLARSPDGVKRNPVLSGDFPDCTTFHPGYFLGQFAGTLLGLVIATAGGFIVYGVLKWVVGLRLTEEEEFNGADLAIH